MYELVIIGLWKTRQVCTGTQNECLTRLENILKTGSYRGWGKYTVRPCSQNH
ncbi:MAG: hypothetical protein MK212_07560 [Saprospiraceae bacterium]|nr:hypothetical protein [Saprospiraceae bacterium]